ncbi:MAG: thioredoxin family protein [Sulfurimonadaceae bacterium]
MKSLILSGLLFAVSLQADHVRWQSDYEKAREKAVKEKKLLMVLLIENECSQCMKMLRTTFKDQSYIKSVNEKYISVLVTNGQKESYPIELLYAIEYPSLFFLDAKEIFTREPITGYVDPDTFEKYLNLQ